MFVSAQVLSYENITDANNVPIAIAITGQIVDDQIAEPWVGRYVIDGDEFAALPAGTDGSAADPRYQAIMVLAAQFVKRAHAAWVAGVLAAPVAVAAPAAAVAAMPTLTPDTLAQLAGS